MHLVSSFMGAAKKKELLFAISVLVAAIYSMTTFAATTGTGSVSVTSGGASGGGIASVAFASSGQPTWSPIEGTSSTISAGDLYTVDSTGSSPYTGDVYITLYLQNGAALAGAYSYLNQMVTVQMLSSAVTGEAVGTGDGSTTQFLLDNAPVAPGTLTVKLGGVAQTEGSSDDYTVNYATGAVTFNSAPGSGVAVTADYHYNDPSGGSTYRQAPSPAGNDLPDTMLALNNGFVSFFVAGDSAGAKYKVVVESGSLYTIDDSGTLGPEYFLSVAGA